MRKEIISDSLSTKLSRRGFMKGVAALSATAALFGCSEKEAGGGGGSSNPLDNMDVFYGATPHNCGGENCVLKVYASGGKVRRVLSDDTRQDKSLAEGDNPQDRACPRCRGRKSTMYYSNRLKYPMIQMGERGNLTTFKRVSWNDAMAYLKEKAKKIENKWGIGTLYGLYGSGAGGTLGVDGMPVAGVGSAVFAGAGNDGGVTHGFEGGSGIISSFGPIQDYSWPAWEHVSPIIMGDYAFYQANYAASNAYSDALNSDAIVIWGHNMSESQWTPQISYYLSQIAEKFKGEVYVIDGRFSQTAALLSNNSKFHYVGVINGTDPALIMGMMHEILSNKDNRDALAVKYGLTNDKGKAKYTADELKAEVEKYVFGVFDTTNYASTNNDPTVSAAVGGKLNFPDGGSWSAYIFGSNDFLTKDDGTGTTQFNKAASIYPDKILYNTRDYKLEEWDWKNQIWTREQYHDVLYGRATKCYGQTEKTAKWASKVTGVPEETIKKLAALFASKKVTVWSGSGFQRCSESEEMVRSWICFNAFCLNFGEKGASFGSVGAKGAKNDKILNPPTPGWVKEKDGDDYTRNMNLNQAGEEQDPPIWVIDPSKGGYNASNGVKTKPSETLSARYNPHFLTATTTGTNLATDYLMSSSGDYCNLTPCFTWLENVEASLADPIPYTQQDKKRVWNPELEDGDGKFEEKDLSSSGDDVLYIRPARYNTGSNQTVSTPTKWIAQVAGNVLANNGGNVNYHVGCYKKTGGLADELNPRGYAIEFISIYDNVFTPSCRYADLILPDTMGFERYQISSNSWGQGRNFVFSGKAANALGDAKSGIDAGYELAKAWGYGEQYRGNWAEDSNGSLEESAWRNAVQAQQPKGQNGNTLSWDQAKKGFIVKDQDPDNAGYENVQTATGKDVRNGNGELVTPGYTNGISTAWKNFRENPDSNPLRTYTGKVEAYSLHYIEDYEARQYANNIDIDNATNDISAATPAKPYVYNLKDSGTGEWEKTDFQLQNPGTTKIYSKMTSTTLDDGVTVSDISDRPRYVYPVPMYIPLIEGRHSAKADNDDTKHPCDMSTPMYDIHKDAPINAVDGCNLTLNTWHMMYRSHSTHNSSGLLNEVKYNKRNAKGEATYFGADADSVDESTGTNVLGAGVYETCWINPETALAHELAEGDLAVVENSRGQAVFSVHISQRVSPGAVFVGHGSWYNLQDSWVSPTGKLYFNIDVGGCANTLTNTRPSRMCGGMTLANDCRVKISKA